MMQRRLSEYVQNCELAGPEFIESVQVQEVLAEYQLVLSQGTRSAGLSKEEKVEMAAKQMRKIKVNS